MFSKKSIPFDAICLFEYRMSVLNEYQILKYPHTHTHTRPNALSKKSRKMTCRHRNCITEAENCRLLLKFFCDKYLSRIKHAYLCAHLCVRQHSLQQNNNYLCYQYEYHHTANEARKKTTKQNKTKKENFHVKQAATCCRAILLISLQISTDERAHTAHGTHLVVACIFN